MMVGTILFAAAAFAVTNTPSSFSTTVERTMPCPIVSEPKVGMKFDLDLPQSSDCQIEAARASTHTDTTAPIAGCGRNKSPRSLTDYKKLKTTVDIHLLIC